MRYVIAAALIVLAAGCTVIHHDGPLHVTMTRSA